MQCRYSGTFSNYAGFRIPIYGTFVNRRKQKQSDFHRKITCLDRAKGVNWLIVSTIVQNYMTAIGFSFIFCLF
jgi:hypothetical protein